MSTSVNIEKILVMFALLLVENSACAGINVWREGTSGGWSTIIHVQNTFDYPVVCNLHFENANSHIPGADKLPGSATTFVGAGSQNTVTVNYAVTSVNANCNMDPAYQARRQQQEQELQRQRAQQAAYQQQTNQAAQQQQQANIQYQQQANIQSQQQASMQQQMNERAQREMLLQQQTQQRINEEQQRFRAQQEADRARRAQQKEINARNVEVVGSAIVNMIGSMQATETARQKASYEYQRKLIEDGKNFNNVMQRTNTDDVNPWK